MANQKVYQDFITPVGRLVQGDPFNPRTTDKMGNPLMFKTGQNAGQPRKDYLSVVAFAKNDPAFAAFHQTVVAFAASQWPQYWNGQGFSHPQFALKIMDGDGTDGDGQPNNTKEGFAGHWLVKAKSTRAPRVFYHGKYAPHEAITDPNLVKCGYYVRIAGSMTSNGESTKPGIFLNFDMLEVVALGPVIAGNGSADPSAFRAVALGALPAGAQALPSIGYGALPSAAPLALPGAGAPIGSALPAALAAPVQPAAMPAPLYVAPNPGILALPVQPLPLALPVVPRMSPTAQGTYEQYKAAGHSDEAMRAAGVLL